MGADIVRITVQGKREADACYEIKNSLVQKKQVYVLLAFGKVQYQNFTWRILSYQFPLSGSYMIPLVADIHFAPSVAMRVAECFDKIRVNPGNFGTEFTTHSSFFIFFLVQYRCNRSNDSLQLIGELNLKLWSIQKMTIKRSLSILSRSCLISIPCQPCPEKGIKKILMIIR